MHCRKLKTVPVVHRHVLVLYINVPSIMVRLEGPPKHHFAIIHFFWDTLYLALRILFSFIHRLVPANAPPPPGRYAERGGG